MSMVGPEAALVRGRMAPRMGLEAYARLEHSHEDPVGVETRSLAGALAGHYTGRLARRAGLGAVGQVSPYARGRDRRSARWSGFLGMLALGYRRKSARREPGMVAGLGIGDGRERMARGRAGSGVGAREPRSAERDLVLAAVPVRARRDD